MSTDEPKPQSPNAPDEEPSSWSFPPRAVSILLFAACLAVVCYLRCQPMFSASALSRPELTYTAEDGKLHPYIAGQDSLSWVRKARNYLRTGTPCDVIEHGECRDLMRHAPVGSKMPYADSLHIQAIAWMHRLVTLFSANVPLPLSASLLQVLLGMLAVVPCWFLGRRISGSDWGGFGAAMLVGSQPVVLQRTANADNEIWAVLLPLCAAWTLVEATESSSRTRRVVWAALAGAALGLHAHIWRGWLFSMAFIVPTLAVFVAWLAVRYLRSTDRTAVIAEARAAATIGATLAVSLLLVMSLRGPGPWLEAKANFDAYVAQWVPVAPPTAASDQAQLQLPYGLRNVGELNAVGRDNLLALAGGRVLVIGALVGAVVLCLPAGAWGLLNLALVALGALGAAGVLLWTDSMIRTACLIAIVFGALVLARRAWDRGELEAPPLAVLLVGTWLNVTLRLSEQAPRFLSLAIVPIGLALGGAGGRIVERFRQTTRDPGLSWLLAGVLTLALLKPLGASVEFVRETRPMLNDAWWNALVKLKRGSPKDSIVHVWWPQGYWVQYIAERAAIADGASALHGITHWTGRALLSGDDRQALGLLRMISCGSGVTNEPEAAQSALARATKITGNSLRAHNLVLELASMTRAQASARLQALGAATDAAEALLQSTHCRPRPSYLVISSAQGRGSDLFYQGTWEPKRAAVLSNLERWPQPRLMSFMTTELGMSDAEAQSTYTQARALKTQRQKDLFVAHTWPLFWLTRCSGGGSVRKCNVDAAPGQTESSYSAFMYNTDTPHEGKFHFAPRARVTEIKPATVVRVGAGGVEVHDVDPKAEPDYSVFIDDATRRVVVGSSIGVRSLYARLLYAPNYSIPGFERVDEQTGSTERVVTFRLKFPEE